MRRVIYNRLQYYFEVNNILRDNQFGFRKGKGTDDALFDFVNYISDAIDKSDYAVSIFCDLTKAFDCVNHSILLMKLKYYGLNGSALMLIESYLKSRKQRVGVGLPKIYSSYTNITEGVPQGSILGPLLFLVYINDISNTDLISNIIMYADDTTALFKEKTKNDMLNSLTIALTNITNWFSVNSLLLNNNKTFAINFHSNYKNSEKSSDEYLKGLVNTSSSGKFLGLHVDDSLTWREHVNHVVNKLNKTFYVILHLSKTLDVESLKMVYYAYVYSTMSYGIMFWGNSFESEDVFRAQKRIVRVMVGADTLTPCRPIFSKLNVLPFPCIYILKMLLYVKTNLSKFTVFNINHNYSTRHQNIIHYPIHRTSLYENTPLYMGIRLYNKLPLKIKEIVNIKKFKSELMSFLNYNHFYSISEYLNYKFLSL